WLRVDAAYGGRSVFAPRLRDLLRGIDRADSITFDAHKWMSVPMGGGFDITRHKDILHRPFARPADNMPKEGADLDVIDPFTHSIQWSRRFIGLKVYLSLVTAGWEGYRSMVQHQTEMGNRLRRELTCSNWKVVNDTVLPVVCFTDSNIQSKSQSDFASFICQEILHSGQAWISVYETNKAPVLRACITNYDTTEEDIMVLMQLLNEARAKYLEETSERSELNL
ncbi:pyridoxal-dependent decarboxylase, partial [Paenibacillus sp. GbtcB18]|uniref:pyridoxal phosphate-dependent decarboxylase family protein n=1 Tax=Paenibacillus sp. GbtcB18 TaxID=2824763 RepID=UPI001C307B9C